MLKWTGGARRKVSTSRKSTQNKQKQYFEHKRRLQQTPSIENPSETNKWVHLSEARSLDILGFTNLATVAQNKEPVYTEGSSSYTQAFYDPSKRSSPAALKKFISLHPTTPNEAYKHNNSCISKEDNGDLSKLSPAMAVKKITSGLSNKPNESGSIPQTSSFHKSFAGVALNSTEKVGEKSAPSIPFKFMSAGMKQKGKSIMQSEVSVLDVLDDEDSERNTLRKSGREAYVAFSVKGLGKVKVETPPQSPMPYQRGFPEPPQRAARCTRNKEVLSIPSETEMVLDSILHGTNLINGVRQSERMGDYGPFVDNPAFDKETWFKDIYSYSSDSFDNFEDSPDCGQDGALDEYIYNQIWKSTYEERANADLLGKRADKFWDTKMFDSDDFYGTSPNGNMFYPTHTGFEEYNSPILRTGTNTKRRLDLNSARPEPSCSPLTMENKYLPTEFDWERDTPKFKRKSDFDGPFSKPVWSFKGGVADLPDTTSLRSEESCFSTRATVKEAKNYSFQSSAQENKKNDVDDFPVNLNLNFNSHKFNNVPSHACDKSTGRTKSNTSGSKLQKTSLLKDDTFLDCDLFPDCKMYTKKSKEPSVSVTMEQRSGTNLDFFANGEEKYNFLPEGMKSSCSGEIGLGMKERCSENEGPKCESDKISDEAENVGCTEADKCSLEESPLVLEACADGTQNTPVQSQQSERCSLAEDNCAKISPIPSQAENQGDQKGKSDAQYQVMLQSYVLQLLCVQKVLLDASEKERK